MEPKQSVYEIKQGIMPWLVWGVACLFYFHQYFLRVSITGMEQTLQENAHLTATMLSNVTASFFYAYIIVQVPGGVLADHYGAKPLLIIATLITSIGCMIFSMAHSVFLLELGRVFMGAGAAFAVVISLMLGRAWFSHKNFVILNGLTLTVGTLGAVLGGAPFAELIHFIGWRPIMIVAGFVSIGLAILAVTVVSNSPKALVKPRKKVSWRKTWRGVKEVLNNRQVWLSGLYTGSLFLPIASFACLWGVPFLMTRYNIGVKEASSAMALMFIGLGLGGPIIGWLANQTRRYVRIMRIGSVMSLLLMLMTIYFDPISMPVMFTIMFFLGFFLGSSSLAFVVVRESTRGYDSGMAFSLTNVFQLSSGAISLPIIGHILDTNWSGEIVNNAHVYLLSNYHKALLIMPISIAISLLFSLFICEPKRLGTKHKIMAFTLAHWATSAGIQLSELSELT